MPKPEIKVRFAEPGAGLQQRSVGEDTRTLITDFLLILALDWIHIAFRATIDPTGKVQPALPLQTKLGIAIIRLPGEGLVRRDYFCVVKERRAPT